ncbi:MAG: hypothetical protein M3N47_04170, partial [Chloroflexota bacterium]|nr:hypothetical protein [Chloroflexota bacterium]
MSIITLIVLLLCFLLVGVGGVEQERANAPTIETRPVEVATPRASDWQEVAGDGYLGVVVPEADAPAFVRAAGWEPEEAYWTPSPEEVEALEAELEDGWAANAPLHARDEDLSGHLRQY